MLDYETKTSYNVTVSVDDSTLGTTPDASTAFTLDVTDAAIEGTLPTVYVSEVAPWSSGNSPVAADWFEVTNGGTTALDITGWKFDDNSNSFAASVALNGITTIAPGESVIFIETASAATVATFRSTWFGANPPAGLQIGTYSGSGVGLSTGGDAVNLYNAAGMLQANVVFGASPTGPFATFDNAAGVNNATISTLSADGARGAFKAVNDAAETGSPGATAEYAPVIGSNGAGSTALIQINENIAEVTIVTATDRNFGDVVTFAITGGADAAKFTSDAATGVLSFVKAPNFEAPTDFGGDNSNDVVVTASDGLLTDSQTIAVTVTDVLDTGSFTGTARADTFTAPNGFDYTIRGLSGADILTGNTGNDVIDGGLGNDLLDGGNDDDVLFGGGGIDTLIGGQGNDVLTGGAQRDNLTGGAGLDRFVLDDIQLLDDTITDFTSGEDRIVLEPSTFAAFQGSEGVAASQFTLGTKATTAEQRLIYDQSLGRLYYDADGNGAGAKKLVATLANRAAISASDFAVQGAPVPSLAASQFVQAMSQFGVVSSGVLGADNDPFAQTPVQPLFAASAAA